MLHHKRISAPLSAFRALRCVDPRPRWNSQHRPSKLPRDSAPFSFDFSPCVAHEQPTRIPYLAIPMAHARTGCVRRFTTTRDNSSQAPEALESTPFIGNDDAAFLQRLVALGSSILQASDMAPLEVQLATPNVPITMKTIGAKVIVSALEQRQQWALLPALLSIPEFRRLAQDEKSGVGEQLFAALLRGQFAFASRRTGSGTAPDVFRTLDLAAKCNALHTQAVTHAVRVGYKSVGLESPTHITELLDVGPTDSTSLQRRAQRSKHDSDADDPTSLGPIGSSMGHLSTGRFISQIALARKTQSVYTVLPAVLAALPRIHNLKPKDRQKILGAVCGRDVYTVSEAQGLARALGIIPDAVLWSQVTSNAVRVSGATDAAAVAQYVFNHVPDGYIAYNVLHQVMSALAGRDYLAVPSRESVELAWKLFELHRTKGGERALYPLPGISRPPASLMPLISAFMADINIPGREAAVEVMCHYTETSNLHYEGNLGETLAGMLAVLAACRTTSHMDALDTALAGPGGPLTEGDIKAIFGSTIRFRYPDATTAPVEALLKVLAFAHDKGFAPDSYYVWTYIRSIYSSILRLHADMGVGLRPVVCGGSSIETVPEQHMSQALASVRRVETLCRSPDFGIPMDERISAALFFAYSVHKGAQDDCARLRSRVLSIATTKDPYTSRAVGTRLLDGARTYKELDEIWRVLSSQGLPQGIEVRSCYANRLLDLHRFHMAIEFARRHIPDDPNEHTVVRFVAWLLLETEKTRFQLEAREALPITTNDPRTREAINKIINHRRGMGLKRMTTVSDI